MRAKLWKSIKESSRKTHCLQYVLRYCISESYFAMYYRYVKKECKGPFVQSIVCLTNLLVTDMLNVLANMTRNTLIFMTKVAFVVQKVLTFHRKIILLFELRPHK